NPTHLTPLKGVQIDMPVRMSRTMIGAPRFEGHTSVCANAEPSGRNWPRLYSSRTTLHRGSGGSKACRPQAKPIKSARNSDQPAINRMAIRGLLARHTRHTRRHRPQSLEPNITRPGE